MIRNMTRYPLIGGVAKQAIRYSANREADKISHHFKHYFTPEIALSETLKEQSFRIRHNVYCEELGYERIRYTGMETDSFDAHSKACVIKHNGSGTYAGTVRAILTTSEKQQLPIEKFCSDAIEERNIHPSNFERHKIAEVSRLAVPASFRRRSTEKHHGAAMGAINEETFSTEEMRCFPFIAISLYFSIMSLLIQEGVEHVYVMVEPKLARNMGFAGINFNQVGEITDYHGRRAPYYITADEALNNLPAGFKCLYNFIDESLLHSRSKQQIQSTLYNTNRIERENIA